MKEVTTPIVKQLNRIFAIMLGATILLLLAVMFGIISFIEPDASTIETAELYAIALTLVAIPLSLKLHSNQIKKLQTNHALTIVQKVEGYTKAFVRRISILEIVALVNIILYSIMHSDNFMWLAVITLIAFVFCRASEDELLSILKSEKEEESGKEEESSDEK